MTKEVEKWDGLRSYLKGEEVSNHGNTFRARTTVNNKLIEPNASNEQFWEKLDKPEPVVVPDKK